MGAFARRHPAVICTVLRLQPVVGRGLDTPVNRLLRAPVVPTFLGYDPRVQLLDADDSVGALRRAVRRPVQGPVNVAGDGVVSLSRALRQPAARRCRSPRRSAARSWARRAARPAARDARRDRALPALRSRRRHHAHARGAGLPPATHSTLEALGAARAGLVAAA